MLSRLSLQGRQIFNPTQLKSLRLFATSSANNKELKRYPHDAPERDLVNFPPPRIPEYPGKVRLGFIPNEWFEALYEKTGVTGPYILIWGSLLTIFSKEYYVYWVDTVEHVVFFIFVGLIAKYGGPKLAKYLDNEVDKTKAKTLESFAVNVRAIDAQINALDALRSLPEANKILHEAKRENVGLQLEAEYRKRLVEVHSQTKKRLDYHVSVQNASKRVEKQEMVNYILTEVDKAVGAAQEKEVFQLCLNQLKTLAAKHAGTV